jgi:hypothetical protein
MCKVVPGCDCGADGPSPSCIGPRRLQTSFSLPQTHWLLHYPTAVDQHDVPDDVGSDRRAKPRDRFGDLLRLADASHGDCALLVSSSPQCGSTGALVRVERLDEW